MKKLFISLVAVTALLYGCSTYQAYEEPQYRHHVNVDGWYWLNTQYQCIPLTMYPRADPNRIMSHMNCETKYTYNGAVLNLKCVDPDSGTFVYHYYAQTVFDCQQFGAKMKAYYSR